MQSFPLICELPLIIDCTGWEWGHFTAPATPFQEFWLGKDKEGNRWLTKLNGAFYAYREIVFARLAQAMGWSCQSSTFMRIDKDSARVLGVRHGEIHAAHWFLLEHPNDYCSTGCSLRVLNSPILSITDLMRVAIAHIMDWPKSEFAAYLFGGGEPPDRLFTTSHEFVIIDSEQMFATGPCNFDTARWWNEPDGSPSSSGRALALEVCIELAALSEFKLQQALRIPAGVSFSKLWPIAPKLKASRRFAADYIASHSLR